MKPTLVIVAALVVLGLSLPAAADHRPTSYCSESGDVCASTERADGARKLRISLTSKFFSNYNLCVTGPNGDKTCKEFRIESQGEGFGDSVRWGRHFPDEGAGAYTVRWKANDFQSKRLGFHVNS